jgi:Protein of unknown function DUF104
MKITSEELKASYRRMPDDELLALDQRELTEMARRCYGEELLRRGLERKPEGANAGAAEEDPLVIVEDCNSAEEAWEIQSALESANIPARVGDPNPGAGQFPIMEMGHFPVAVPASFAQQARQLLNAQAPDAIIVAARYENGVFKPLDEIEIQEGALVEVHVSAGSLR